MSGERNLSFIEDHEVDEAKAFVKQRLAIMSGIPDIEMFRATGYHMVVMLYIREEDVHQIKDDQGNAIIGADGKPLHIAIPSSVRANDKWMSCTALVVEQGPDCYNSPRFEKTGPWCKVGDWVIIPRNEGTQINYRGIHMQIIPDDRVIGVVSDPSFVTKE
jgi:co-chaperonin GroES (HSP10)